MAWRRRRPPGDTRSVSTRDGPPLELLLRRVVETPPDFLAEPRIGASGQVHVDAVVNDLCEWLGVALPADALGRFTGKNAARDRNRLSIALVQAHLLADPWFRAAGLEPAALLALLGDGAAELAAHTPAPRFLADPDRREELVRHLLARLGMHPAGESAAHAQDRLTTLSAAERARVLAASRAAQERAREVREALSRKAAQEAADKWTRE